MLKKISPEEAAIREKQFSKRIIPLNNSASINSIGDLYASCDHEFQTCITQKSFIESFSRLNQTATSEFLNSLKNKNQLSYLDLPAVAALEINSKLVKTPSSWS